MNATARKWRFAIGTTSRVPDCPVTVLGGLHYLILDIDRKEFPFHTLGSKYIAQPTRSGWHIYTPQTYYFEVMLEIALDFGADPFWCGFASRRGYAFLADKSPVAIPWPVERMVIGQDAKRLRRHKLAK